MQQFGIYTAVLYTLRARGLQHSLDRLLDSPKYFEIVVSKLYKERYHTLCVADVCKCSDTHSLGKYVGIFISSIYEGVTS